MQIVLDVVRDFPGGRVRRGDRFVLDWSDPEHPISEVRHHGPEAAAFLHRNLTHLTCLTHACHACEFALTCPLASRSSRREREWLRVLR
jgi:hypothetical protein